DWKTLQIWHTIQGITFPSPTLIPVDIPTALSSGPNSPGLSGDLFGRFPVDAASHTAYLPTITMPGTPPLAAYTADLDVYDSGSSVTASPLTQVYLLEDAAQGHVTRILPQGQVLGTAVPATGLLGSISIWGVQPDDRVRVYLDRYTTTAGNDGRFVYPTPGTADVPLDAGGTAVQVNLDPWLFNLDWEQGLSNGQLTSLTVKLESFSHTLGGNTSAQLCSLDAAIGCSAAWMQTMTPAGVDTWAATFTPLPGSDALPAYAILRISDPQQGEIVRWYQQLGGVGPGHIDADAPLRDWQVMVDSSSSAPAPGDCNHVIVTPATNARALAAPLGVDVQNAPIGGLIGTPLDIDILLPNDGTCAYVGTTDHTLPIPVTLTLFYSEATINQLGIDELDLRLLRFERGQGNWSVAAYPSSQDTDLNWVSLTSVIQDGIYALGYIAP
ncbi:MAG: hypothetical protein KC443_03725, partial [Anaerolineales bacterium]|nr:hypothetical protein [Anaerolineales bacterium]